MDTLQQFPIEKDQTHLQRWVFIVSLVMLVLSLIGLITPQALYPGDGQADAYRVNDLVNLLIGFPGVLLALHLMHRKKLVGLLFLPGALLYIFYTYLAYTFGITFSLWTAAWAVLVIASGILFFRLLFNLNSSVLRHRLKGSIPAVFAGIVLAVFGLAFAGLAFNILSTSQLTLPHPDLGLAIADIVVSLIWLTGGVLLLLKKPAGFAWGLGLLYAAVLLFAAVIVLVAVRPFLTDVPFAIDELVTLSGMALICLIPFGLFVRGVMKKEKE